MEEHTEYCPHVSSCPFYKNWTDLTRDKRIDVIVHGYTKSETPYNCLTLMVLDDTTNMGIPMRAELKERLSKPENTNQRSSHITSLNLLESFRID